MVAVSLVEAQNWQGQQAVLVQYWFALLKDL
jgi:hypothetical protein